MDNLNTLKALLINFELQLKELRKQEENLKNYNEQLLKIAGKIKELKKEINLLEGLKDD